MKGIILCLMLAVASGASAYYKPPHGYTGNGGYGKSLPRDFALHGGQWFGDIEHFTVKSVTYVVGQSGSVLQDVNDFLGGVF